MEVNSVKVTPLRLFDVPEVLLSQEVPSDEISIVPSSLTETYNLVEVVVSSFVPLVFPYFS